VSEWSQLIEVRDRVNVALEAARQQKIIGNSLGASVRLRAGGAMGERLERYRSDLPMLFIVSDVQFSRVGDETPDVEVSKAEGAKCPRCWRTVPSLVEAADGEICGRCAEAVAQTVA
jgi:isoleucyl-tRNA synthetase